MEKLLRVLMLLSGNRNYSITEMKERCHKSERSIYRYLDIIERSGFILDRKNDPEGCRYRLITDKSYGRALESLLHFSEEEAWLLYRVLTDLKAGSALKERLVRKLNILYDFKALENLEKTNDLQRVHVLRDAINHKKQVLLLQYRSSNSGAIADRKVEPFEFTEDYCAVWCFDTKDKSNKQFKISRMQEVKPLPSSWEFETNHQIPFTDAFHMAADRPVATVEAILSLKAYNLLREEYPLAEKYISQQDKSYHLKIPVADYHGIGRFVMGLPGEINVPAPEGFKKFLRENLKKKITTDRIWQ